MNLPIEYLSACLSYDPQSGEVRWTDRPREHFANQAAHTTHQRTKAGQIAGCIDQSTGYQVIGLNRTLLYAHRVAWALAHGAWPVEQIDHIDGDKLNNRIGNLRQVSQAENTRNAARKRNNTSGETGVNFARREGKWRARVMRDYREVFCGYYETYSEAVEARREAAKAFGFHANHGRSA